MKNFKKVFSLRNSKGFTLIELLVVVAIIGILASVVLASLSTARNKGKIASATASLSSMRAQAELSVTSAGTYPVNICLRTTGDPLDALMDAVEAQAGGTVTCNTPVGNTDGTFNSWAASIDVDASSTTTLYCVDSTGWAGSGDTTKDTATAGVCA